MTATARDAGLWEVYDVKGDRHIIDPADVSHIHETTLGRETPCMYVYLRGEAQPVTLQRYTNSPGNRSLDEFLALRKAATERAAESFAAAAIRALKDKR